MDEKLPDGWVETTLGDVVIPERILEQCRENWKLRFVGLEHVESETMRLIGTIPAQELKSTALHFWPGDVLYGRLRPYLNKVLHPDFEGLCSPEFLVFRNSVNFNSSYLQYFLNSWSFKEFSSHQITGDRPRVHWEQLKAFNFSLPPLPEQSRIISVIEQQFTRLDSAIASLKSAKARSKQYRASLLKSAVEGELTREWRAEHPVSETGEQLLARILQERRAKWEEEQLAKMREKGVVPKDETWREKYEEPEGPDVEKLPELPEGWCYTLLQPLLSVGRKGMVTGPFGSLLKKYEHQTEGVPVFGIENIAAMKFVAGNKIYITEDKSSELSQYEALPGDILISRSGTVGEVCVVPENLGEARISTNLMRVSLMKNSMLPQFFCILFNGSPFVLDQVSELCKGSTRDFLSQAILSRIIFPLPPLAEQEQIIAEVEARLSNIEHLEKATEDNLKRAERERQSILQEAFAGRLVPQDPNDEPASILLERIREERKKREEEEKIVKISRKGSQMEAAKKRQARKVLGREAGVGLYEVLVAEGEPLQPQEVFRKVGLKTEDQPESVETFYEELRSDVADDLIGVIRPDTATVLLEALDVPVEEELEGLEHVEEEIGVVELAQEGEEEDEKLPPEWPTLWDELDNA